MLLINYDIITNIRSCPQPSFIDIQHIVIFKEYLLSRIFLSRKLGVLLCHESLDKNCYQVANIAHLRGNLQKNSICKDIVQIGGREVNPISKNWKEIIFWHKQSSVLQDKFFRKNFGYQTKNIMCIPGHTWCF